MLYALPKLPGGRGLDGHNKKRMFWLKSKHPKEDKKTHYLNNEFKSIERKSSEKIKDKEEKREFFSVTFE